VNGNRVVERVRVTTGDRQVASHVGLHLLGEIAERTGLAFEYSAAVPFAGERASVHDRGRLLAQVAVMLAGGGICVSDMAALRDQPDLFGEVASDPTIWRTFQQIDDRTLDGLRQARAEARRAVWAAMDDAPAVTVLDVDSTLIEVHSENKEGAASHYKGGYGFHPMLCFADHTGEALAGMFRPGNAGANSAADQLAVVDAAIASLPPERQAGHEPGDDPDAVVFPMVVRADSAGAVHGFIGGLVARNIEFSVYGRVSDGLWEAIEKVPGSAWRKAIRADGEERHAGEVAELDLQPAGWPRGTRAICRREEPHQGAQLRLWDQNGWRYQVTLTNSAGDDRQLELRQRLHARVENHIKALRDTGLERMPFTKFAANAAWFELVLAGADLLAWLRTVCLDGDLARAEPKTLRYRLLHTAGRIIRRARRIILRLPEHWRWAVDLAHAYQRLDQLGA
jgi:hypothetical protein